MTVRQALLIQKHDVIITAYCESACGPGWSNQPLWVVVQDGDRKLRLECLQPEEQPLEIKRLYRLLEEAQKLMVKALRETP